MKKIGQTYVFESTGRKIDATHADGFSLDVEEDVVRLGYDSYVDFYDENTKEYSRKLTDVERYELATYLIGIWKQFGNIQHP